MKKLILFFIFVLSFQCISAQDKEAFRKDILKMLEVNKANSKFEEAKEQILKIIPKENHPAFLKEFNASTQPIYDKFVALYMKEFTHDDIKAMLKFFESPLGKKMSQKLVAINQEVYASSKEWADGLRGLVMKHMNTGAALPPPLKE
ncbi:DUF2059 domain-containing protein [Flavobacterium pedocola]